MCLFLFPFLESNLVTPSVPFLEMMCIITEIEEMTGCNIVHNISQKTSVFFKSHPILNWMIFFFPHSSHTLLFPPLLLIHLLSGAHAACGPAAAAAVCVATNREQAGETRHDRLITMLQHHTNWPGAYRESVVFSGWVFLDMRAGGS